MKTPAPLVDDPPGRVGIRRRDPPSRKRSEDELIIDLERDQLVAETSRPLPRAQLGARARVGLWTLRVVVVLLTLMVLYTFIARLH